MHRTQLYLDEATHLRLKELARRQGRTLSELVRDAVDRTYGASGSNRLIKSLEAVAGLWKDRDDIGGTEEYVRRLRDDTKRTRYLEKAWKRAPERGSSSTRMSSSKSSGGTRKR